MTFHDGYNLTVKTSQGVRHAALSVRTVYSWNPTADNNWVYQFPIDSTCTSHVDSRARQFRVLARPRNYVHVQ